MKNIFYIIILLSSGHWLRGQGVTISPQVLNSAGSSRSVGTGTNIINLTDNVGEPFINTLSSGVMISQGFVQPEEVSSNDFTVTAFVTDVYCSGKNDGRISTAINTTAFNYNAKYFWKPAALCPNNDCTSLDSLKAGDYSLTVVFSYTTLTGAAEKTIVVSPSPSTTARPSVTLKVQDLNGPCMLKVFTGITINGDGLNDHLYIENISEFPKNKITIFNRWGAQLYEESGYDNINKFWPRPDDVNKLVPSTYFYVLDPGDGSKIMKGWIEIIKN